MSEHPFEPLIGRIHQLIDESSQSLREKLGQELESAKGLATTGGGGGSFDLLHGGFQKLAQSMTQTDLLTQLLEASALFSPRVVLFIIKGDQLLGWAARGFEKAFEKGVRRVKWAVGDYAELTKVVKKRHRIYTNFNDLSDLSDEISRFDGFVPVKSAFYPIQVRGKVAAVLYADSGKKTAIDEPNALDMLSYIAGHELTMITMKLKKETDYQTREMPAVESPPQSAEPAAPPPPVQSAPPPPVAREPEPEPPPVVMPEPTPPPAPTPTPAPAPEVDSDDRNIKKAKRVARVLVSDIKLYHENEVAIGQQRGNLYDLLKEDIDRSFQHFKERTGDIAPAGTNYFKDELIRQLTDGNPSLLGNLPF